MIIIITIAAIVKRIIIARLILLKLFDGSWVELIMFCIKVLKEGVIVEESIER
jgi:hypothetical protein